MKEEHATCKPDCSKFPFFIKEKLGRKLFFDEREDGCRHIRIDQQGIQRVGGKKGDIAREGVTWRMKIYPKDFV